MRLTIDAHQHFWQLGRKPFDYGWLEAPQNAAIRRDYLPENLKPLIDAVHVDRTVFVQTQHNIDENRWVLDLAARHPFIVGVVGWVDLASPRCEEQVNEFRRNPKFVGVRHITQDEPNDDFIIREDVIRGLKVLEKYAVPFDLLFYVKHLRHAAPLGRQLPNLPMVIDHLAKPHIKDQQIDDWLPNSQSGGGLPEYLLQAVRHGHRGRLEALEAGRSAPYVQHALELFGPDRCMFGSDWPVCELAGTYEQVYYSLVEALGPLSDGDPAKIFGETAVKFYGLRV